MTFSRDHSGTMLKTGGESDEKGKNKTCKQVGAFVHAWPGCSNPRVKAAELIRNSLLLNTFGRKC